MSSRSPHVLRQRRKSHRTRLHRKQRIHNLCNQLAAVFVPQLFSLFNRPSLFAAIILPE